MDKLVHDWNQPPGSPGASAPTAVLDDTLRDGLQNASVRLPSLDARLLLVRRAAELGVECVNLGLPAASDVAFEETAALCRAIREERVPLSVACAGRTLVRDMEPIVELVQRTGLRVEAHCFVGSSPVRLLAEGWSPSELEQRSARAIDVAVRAGLEAVFVTEDTTRSRPDFLERLFARALDHGATRLCLCDTVGHATPEGASRLVEFARSVVERSGTRARLDWHGHNDRGLGLAAALAAVRAGVDRVHATALGIGERVGNTPLELLVLNLALEGRWPHRLEALGDYVDTVARVLGWSIPKNYPVFGENAFRTATGVHAAAIRKAEARDKKLADLVYSSVPSAWFGREQRIAIGPMSGTSNVKTWLERENVPVEPELVAHIVRAAKRSDHILSDAELHELVREHTLKEPQGRT
ncbi:MAG TPA: 2-isopropylmalate synthase [Polyangiaceae bacterium]|nr:2-isopropylmalate synthase [Polyangiaceae bacterium]